MLSNNKLSKDQFIQKMKNNAGTDTKQVLFENHAFTKYITDILYANYCLTYEWFKTLEKDLKKK